MHPIEPIDEINELKNGWRGTEAELEIAIRNLQRPITAEVIEHSFLSVMQGSGSASVALLQRYQRLFTKTHRWDDSGIVAIASHFMVDDDDLPYLVGYVELLEHRARVRPALLDEAYHAAPEQSALRGYIGALRLRRYKKLDSRATNLLKGLVSHPGLQLSKLGYETWPDKIKASLRRLDSLCSCCA